MTHPNEMYSPGDFPWLPAQGHVTPNPAYSFKEWPHPPPWLMTTLESLDQGHNPEGDPPLDWLEVIKQSGDCTDAMRAFARECFGIADLGENESARWYVQGKAAGSPMEELSAGEAWRRIWRGYCALVLADLNAAQENVADARQRIATQWQSYSAARDERFWQRFEGAASWPPRLAIVWIMYGGSQQATCRYFCGNAQATESADYLNWTGLSLDHDPEIVDRKPSASLLTAARRSPSHTKRVVLRGLLGGDGLLAEIAPHDLARLEFQLEPGMGNGAVLLPMGWSATNRLSPVYTQVVVDRESLWVAYPPAQAAAPVPSKPLKPETFAADHKAEIIARIKARGDKPTNTAVATELRAQYAAAGGTSTANVSTWERYVRRAGL